MKKLALVIIATALVSVASANELSKYTTLLAYSGKALANMQSGNYTHVFFVPAEVQAEVQADFVRAKVLMQQGTQTLDNLNARVDAPLTNYVMTSVDPKTGELGKKEMSLVTSRKTVALLGE